MQDLYGTTADVHSRKVFTGRSIAHGHRTRAQRALAAADVFDGKATVDDFTQRQVAALFRISVPSVQKARRVNGDRVKRWQIEQGESLNGVMPNGNANGLTRAWLRASSAERAALGRVVGIDAIWDRAIAPNIV